MIDSYQLSLANPFLRSLGCAALSPGLRSILLFDTSPEILRLAAKIIAQMLEAITGQTITSVTLGTWETEEDLWGSWGLNRQPNEQILSYKLGLLAGEQEGAQLRIIIISDLAKLSLATTRACVVLMGSEIANLERHGKQSQWQPQLCWIAGCASQQVGMVSPHLLDRFALRLKAQIPRNSDKIESIQKWLNCQQSKQEFLPAVLSSETVTLLQSVSKIQPKITEVALERILDYISTLKFYSPRREIALARFVYAHAQLEASEAITATHVDDVATKILGLNLIVPEESKPESIEESSNLETHQREEKQLDPSSKEESIETSNNIQSVYNSDTTETKLDTYSIPTSSLINPYPEDISSVEREAASLRLPLRRFRSKTVAKGTIIGVEKATNVQDIALVSTLVEAAKYQSIRPKNSGNGRLKIHAIDLQSYRRAPVAEQLFMLLLDYTCLEKCKWQAILLPYLNWAYVERASVCLIQVGAANARDELQAEKITAQSILVPRFSEGLVAGKGKATPLAHGLDLALQTLRHSLQHGRSTVQKAVFLTISDGRGNIPLEASRNRHVTPPVGRRGFEDALLVAEGIRNLQGVKAVLLNPQPQQYPDFPHQLAEALGATVLEITPVEVEEVGG